MAVLALTLHLCAVTSKALVESAIQLTRRNLAPEFRSSSKSPTAAVVSSAAGADGAEVVD